MAESKLRDLAMDLAVEVLKRCGNIKGHFSITNQLERSDTSIGANIHEANDSLLRYSVNRRLCKCRLSKDIKI